MTESKKLLFVCVENAGRSQMAEGFLRKFAPQYDVISAGTDPKFKLIPDVIDVMKEIGIDITEQKPKELTDDMIAQSIVVNMGCMDKEMYPALFVDDVINWDILDPKDKDIEAIRKIRDQIKNEVLNLIKKLES